jgi:hypothetical protein
VCLVCSSAGSAHVWDIETGREACPPLAHADLVLDAQFSPDGKMVATASRDDTARLWQVATGLPLSEPLPGDTRVECLAFSPDGHWLATGSADGSVRIWEVPTLVDRPPDWLPDLAEALARLKVNAAGHAEPVPPPELEKLKEVLQRSTAQDDYTLWAKWLLSDSQTRPISPSATLTRSTYVAVLLGSGQMDYLRQAARLALDDPQVQAALATAFIRQTGTNHVAALREADWRSRYAMSLAPSDPQVQRLFGSVLGRGM